MRPPYDLRQSRAPPTPGAMMAYLEYYPPQKGLVRRIPLAVTPFRIGRNISCEFVIASSQVSKVHAEIFRAGEQYRIKDLDSTNGIYINGFRVNEAPLTDDDIFHVAHEEFRFIVAVEENDESPALTEPAVGKMPLSVARGSQYLQELIRKQWVRILFQPIVHLETRETMGYEALARGMHNELSAKPGELFTLAERCGMTYALSKLFREMAVLESAQLPCEKSLFLNLHPSEVLREDFVDSLREVQALAPASRQLVLEIHENVTCELPVLRRLRQQVQDMGIQLAYDDFGAGQARFLELAELPPDFVKLDMRLIKNIDQAEPRRNLLRALARASVELGIQVVAEGVETPEEAEVCRELGCQYGQGFFFGLPKVATCIRPKHEKTKDINVAELRSRLRAQEEKVPAGPSGAVAG